MKLADSRKAYQAFSSKASDIARQLGFAGVGIIWLFRTGSQISDALVPPAVLIVVGLAFDLLQCVYGAAVWGAFHNRKARELEFDEEVSFTVPAIINWPTNFFFWGKLLLIALAYAYLGIFVSRKLL